MLGEFNTGTCCCCRNKQGRSSTRSSMILGMAGRRHAQTATTGTPLTVQQPACCDLRPVSVLCASAVMGRKATLTMQAGEPDCCPAAFVRLSSCTCPIACTHLLFSNRMSFLDMDSSNGMHKGMQRDSPLQSFLRPQPSCSLRVLNHDRAPFARGWHGQR